MNLPGFGPVAMSPDGSRAVGFTRRDDMISQWGYAQKEMVGLITVELPSLAWTVIEYGPKEPTYVLADQGRKILAHDAFWLACDWSWSPSTCEETTSPISIFDLEKGTRSQLEGPSVTLERFSSDEAGRTFWFPDGLGDVVKVNVNAGVSETLARRWPGSPELLSRFELRRGETPATHPLLVLGEDDRPIFYVLKPFGTETIEVEIQTSL